MRANALRASVFARKIAFNHLMPPTEIFEWRGSDRVLQHRPARLNCTSPLNEMRRSEGVSVLSFRQFSWCNFFVSRDENQY